MSGSHEMVRVTASAESDAEEWSCTQCSRRLLITWPPGYQKIVLDRGDDAATHNGTRGGLQIRAGAQIAENREPTSAEREWLSTYGMDWDDGTASG